MPKHPTETGPAGERTAGSSERTRTDFGFAQLELADRVTALGRPMSNTLLSHIERIRWRCDIDDLVAITAALGVSPLAPIPAAAS
jgi:transcriptional regulator with XRE-family HTH domain